MGPVVMQGPGCWSAAPRGTHQLHNKVERGKYIQHILLGKDQDHQMIKIRIKLQTTLLRRGIVGISRCSVRMRKAIHICITYAQLLCVAMAER